ncbi:TRAP transporter small permease [Microbacterium sp.]|jgi:TRAP-type C4-dicarboxylate transport system permease small subunit|uniref:TRAP transporter small permease n=1 Tax=Microbacterium sp. TaxID=51671 RepID=UPI002B6D785A|nr:TRAP transporter small permease [Microbacterium sp.]HWL78311.1 TRAP transporter small permease [Microbacterium sp.]
MSRRDEPEESIYGHTETVYTSPDVNVGVPPEPWFLRVLSSVEVVVSVVLFAGIFIGVMWQVIGRYFPKVSWLGAGELALLSMIAMTFAMIGYLTGRNGHIVIELWDQLLEGRPLFAVLRIVSAVIMAGTCAWMAYDAWVKIGLEWSRESAAIGIPLGVLYIFALLGVVSAAIHSVWKIRHANRPERRLEIDEMEG